MKSVVAFLLSYLSITYGWSCTEAPQMFPAAQIDAGQGQVLMRDGLSNVYFLHKWSWYKLGTAALKHVSVGPSGIWGIDSSDNVYKYVNGDFIRSTGQTLQQVDAGGEGHVVGVTSSSTIHCLKNTIASTYRKEGALRWNNLSGSLTYLSCGPLGCWGVSPNQEIYYTKIAPATCEFRGWMQVPGNAKMVEVGSDGAVFVVHPEGSIYQRAGISVAFPQGTEWVQLPMCLPVRHASYDQGHLWVVSNGGIILRCSH